MDKEEEKIISEYRAQKEICLKIEAESERLARKLIEATLALENIEDQWVEANNHLCLCELHYYAEAPFPLESGKHNEH